MIKHGRKSESQKQEENVVFWDTRKKLQESSIEKWSGNSIGGVDLVKLFDSNAEKAGNAAISLSLQEQSLQRMTETVMATAFGTSIRPENLLKAVYIGTANSKRGDIWTEYPLQTIDDALYYVNMAKEKTLRGTTAGDKVYETIDPDYAGESYYANLGTGDASVLTFTDTLTPTAVIPFKIRITVGGAQVGVDDGAGSLTGTTISAGTIDYATGAVSVTFSSAPALGASVDCYFNWNSEDSTNYDQYATISIGLTKTRFSARPMPLGYKITDFTNIMFESNGLGSAMGYMEQAIGHEHAKSKDFRAIRRARQIALGNNVTVWNADSAGAGEFSYANYAQLLTNDIRRVGGVIYNEIQRGEINKIVAGSEWVSYASLHKNWKDDLGGDSKEGVYRAGFLGTMEVFQCPADANLVASNEALLTYKNPEVGLDLSIVFGVHSEISADLRYPQMYTEGYSAVIEDAKVINTKFCRLHRITGLL